MTQIDIMATGAALLTDAKVAGADAADMVMVASTDIAVSQRNGTPEDIERAESSAIGLRVFVDGKSAMVSSTDFSATTLKETAQRAVAMAKASVADPYVTLAPNELWVKNISELELYEDAEPSVEWLQAQCALAEDAALSHEGITNSEGAEAHVSRNRIALMTSEGFAQEYRTSSCSLSLSVIAGKGDKMERDYAYSVKRFTSDLGAAKAIGDEAARRTLQRMNPKKVSTQSVPVVFDPRVGRSLLGNFASAINGSAIARGTSFLKNKMGEAVFAKGINIVDDPHIVRGLGSKPFDGEGVANQKRLMVQDGVLQSWILDMRSANQLSLNTTGHAVRGISSAPHPSSTNFYMQAGEVTLKDMLSGIKNGFYVTNAFGMGVNLITGDYSQGASGLWIENGELSYAVSEVTIAGHLSDMFTHLTPANDLVFDYSTNVPTFMIEPMMVAGV